MFFFYQALAKRAFLQRIKIRMLNVDVEIRNELLKTYVWGLEYYGWKSWTIEVAD